MADAHITTTLSFRAAVRWGVPHFAGQRVDLRPDAQGWTVTCKGEVIRRHLWHVSNCREPGGLDWSARLWTKRSRRRDRKAASEVASG